MQKVTVRSATVRHDGLLFISACHRVPLAAGLLPRVLGRVLERHVSRCAGARARSGGFPRQAPCRGRRLVVFGSLSLTGPCRDAGRVAASFPWYALSGLPGKLLLPGSCLFPARSSCRGLGSPSRQAPLAGALVGPPGKLLLPGPWFEYFVLEWSSREPRRVLAVTRQALPRGAATARARVRGNRVPLL